LRESARSRKAPSSTSSSVDASKQPTQAQEKEEEPRRGGARALLRGEGRMQLWRSTGRRSLSGKLSGSAREDREAARESRAGGGPFDWPRTALRSTRARSESSDDERGPEVRARNDIGCSLTASDYVLDALLVQPGQLLLRGRGRGRRVLLDGGGALCEEEEDTVFINASAIQIERKCGLKGGGFAILGWAN